MIVPPCRWVSIYLCLKFSHGWMSDTHPDALRVYLEIHSRRPPERKLGDVHRDVRRHHFAPDLRGAPLVSGRQRSRSLSSGDRRRLGPELMKKVYGLATRSLGLWRILFPCLMNLGSVTMQAVPSRVPSTECALYQRCRLWLRICARTDRTNRSEAQLELLRRRRPDAGSHSLWTGF